MMEHPSLRLQDDAGQARIIQSPRRKPVAQVQAARLSQKSGLDRPRLARSSLTLPGPKTHRDRRTRTAIALSGSQGWPSGALSSVRSHLPQTSRGRAVALDSPLAVAPFHALPARRRATTGSPRHAKCGRERRASRRRGRTYPAHGARHRNKNPKKCVPIRSGAAAKGKESARDAFQQQRSLGRAAGVRPQSQ